MTGEAYGREIRAVSFEVRQIWLVSGRGRLLALAAVEMSVAGVCFGLVGIPVGRTPEGLVCRPPRWCDPDSGAWTPCLALPPAPRDALADEALRAAAVEPGCRMRRDCIRAVGHNRSAGAAPPRPGVTRGVGGEA